MTIKARLLPLQETRERVLEAGKKYDEALGRLDYKIERYEEAVRTGRLVWKKKETE